MAGYSAIRAVSLAVREALQGARLRAVFPQSEVEILQFSDLQLGKVARLNLGLGLYLHRVGINGARHGFPARTLSDGTRLRPPLTLDLHYLVGAWAENAEQQQLLLGWCLRTIHEIGKLPATLLNKHVIEEPVGSPPDEALREALRFQADEAVELTIEPLSLQEMSYLWDGLRPPLTVGLAARAVRLDPPRRLAEHDPVRERRLAVGKEAL